MTTDPGLPDVPPIRGSGGCAESVVASRRLTSYEHNRTNARSDDGRGALLTDVGEPFEGNGDTNDFLGVVLDTYDSGRGFE